MIPADQNVNVDGKQYTLRYTQTKVGLKAQAYDNDRPAGPPVTIDFGGWELDKWERFGQSKEGLLAAILQSAQLTVLAHLSKSRN